MQKVSPSWQDATDWQWQDAWPARDRHPASGRAVWAGNKTAMDPSKNPHGEKTLMHLLRDLTAKWGLCSAINCKIGLQMRCSAI